MENKNGLKVVLVDDSALVRERVADLLSALEGVEVVGQAADVPAGARLLRECRPHVLVLDIDLPGQSGMELLEAAKIQYESLFIIMLTNLDHPKLRQRCAELGASFFFNKPTELEKTFDVCRQLADRRTANANMTASSDQIELEAAIKGRTAELIRANEALRTEIVERKRAEDEIRRMNRLYAVLSQVNQTLIRAGSREELFPQVCRIAVEQGGLRAAWIGLLDPQSRAVLPVAHAGGPEQYFGSFKIFADDRPEGQGPTGTALRYGRPCVFNDFQADPRTMHWSHPAQLAGVHSAASFPIRLAGEVCGALSLYDTEKNVFQEKEVALLTEVADSISSGLDRLDQAARERRAEESLRESQEKLRRSEQENRQLIEDARDAIFTLAHDGTIASLNRACETISGWRREEWIGREFRSLVHPDDVRVAWDVFMQIMGGQKPEPFQVNILTKSGEYIPIEFAGTAKQLDHEIVGVLGIGRDMRERRRAEETVRKNEARYRLVLKETGQIVYEYDLATGLIQWEGNVDEVLGYTREEMRLIGAQQWEEHIHPDDRRQALALLDKAIKRGHRYHVEYRFRRKEGAYIFVEEHGSFLPDAHGQPVRMVGTMSNITERKDAEERIREQARLLDLAHDAIIVRDLSDNILYWNESAERLYGWTAEAALGQNAAKLLRQDSAKSAEAAEAVLGQDEWNGELTHFTKAGQEVLVETRLTLVRDRHGHPKSILAINTDITQRKKLEAQFLRAQRMESIGTLAGGIAHDLNNILAPIMMSCQLLEGCANESEHRQLLGMISTSAQRGADLVKQVLFFSRGVEGRRMELRATSVIKEIQHILRETFPKSVQFETSVAKDLWSVVADPTQLHQVLLNLCVNARDAMPNGGKLSLTAENVMLDGQFTIIAPDAKPAPHVVISVADTGTGIPPELREKIFDPFFTTKELGKGTGLGLSTSLAIVKSHGGFINVYSEPGQGTIFKVYLPALTTSNVAALQAREAQLPRGRGELVLVVDDEASVRTITKQTLQAFGYHAITAADGAEALSVYARSGETIAAVLTDMMMPVMDGPTTIHALTRNNPNLKVIAASGLSPEIHMSKAPNDAVKAYLPKPYTAETLLKTLHEVLHGVAVGGVAAANPQFATLAESQNQ